MERILAFAHGLHDDIAGVVDEVGVVAEAALEQVAILAAIQRVVALAAGSASSGPQLPIRTLPRSLPVPWDVRAAEQREVLDIRAQDEPAD